jgi:hypothetical protein
MNTLVPQNNALYAEPLVDQVIALLQLYLPQALPMAGLDPVKDLPFEFHKGTTEITQPVWVEVTVGPLEFPDSSPQTVQYTAPIIVKIFVIDPNPDQGMHRINQYLVALDRVLSTIEPSDLLASQSIVLPPGTPARPTTPPAPGTVSEVHRASHRRGQGPPSEAGPRWAGEIQLDVFMEET